MKKARRAAKERAKIAAPKAAMPPWAMPLLIAVLVAIFYWVPMTSVESSIQWDAADLHYPFQRYFSEHIRSGILPQWTPYLYSGYPFLAYPETGCWYLPHWLFFLLGITPRSIQIELALNAFLACLGAFLLLSRMVEKRSAALLGALCYGLSGFFAGHASHVGIFAAASCFPWLLLAFRRAADAAAVRYTALGGLVGAAMILAGYIQTAMYGFLALGLYALWEIYLRRHRWRRFVSIVAGMLAISLAVAAIQIFPTVELVLRTFRAKVSYSHAMDGGLEFRSLPTLIWPDWLGAISSHYTGPFDITQYYFYAGFLLLPLAVAGAIQAGRRRGHALMLIVPSMWFMFGPSGGLYRVAMWIPGLRMVREPIQGWFVVALGLAMLAAVGFDWIEARWRVWYLAPLALAVLFGDLWFWNSLNNPLAYGHFSYQSMYGVGEDALRIEAAPRLPPLTRLDYSRNSSLGPLDFPLDLRLESTAGYGALPIGDYNRYKLAWRQNSKLNGDLNIGASLVWDARTNAATVKLSQSTLPRAFFPRSVIEAPDTEAVLRALTTLDPAAETVIQAPHELIQQDPAAVAQIVWHDEQSYRIRTRAASPSVLRLAAPWYAGWRATTNGKTLPIVKVDLAFMGVVVPPGDREIEFHFHSDSFDWGVTVTLAGLTIVALLVWKGSAPSPTGTRWDGVGAREDA